MAAWLIMLIASVVFVGLFALGMSLTLMFKGHHIQSEISANPNMRKLGIRCVVEEAREAQCGGKNGNGSNRSNSGNGGNGGADSADGCGDGSCDSNCAGCGH